AGIQQKTLGIIGLGQIGTAVARRARAFGMAIAYTGPRRAGPELEAELDATFLPLDELLATADVVSLHCPLRPETHHLIGPHELEQMKRSAFLVNTARGPVVDEAALVGALDSGTIAGAGLDVFEHEPAVNPKLLKLPNVVLLPHMSSATIEGRVDMGEKVIVNIRTWMDGHKPPDRVIPSML
ncbi:MAG TPA: NAD(P)-dependent oxidoreductase, partial [Caulobacteraceae bacterium]|nr:NAD(P)-dependent oxidoreductase [Caulobacteraceae bacterium]